MKFISVKYSCKLCGIKDKDVKVPERTTEDIVVWMEQIVIIHLCDDHHKQSPNCDPETLQDVKIYIPENVDILGGAEPTKH